MAPAWMIDNLHTAYSAVKYLGVFVMTATVFPAYGLARMVVGKRPALFVALASAAIPALAYSAMIVEEPLAYPYATLCLYLIARALITPTRISVAAAVLASIVAPLVRGELGMIPVVFASPSSSSAGVWTACVERARRGRPATGSVSASWSSEPGWSSARSSGSSRTSG